MALKKLSEIPESQTAKETDILAVLTGGEINQCTEGVLIQALKTYILNNMPE